MKHALTFLALAAVLMVGLVGCRTFAAEGTPAELQAVPTLQSILLASAIDSIVAGDAAWVDGATGNVLRDAVLDVLRADKNAWDELDRFYNPETAEPAPAPAPTE